MWYIGGGILYLVLLVTLGILCIRNGHWVLFIVGIFLPVHVAHRRSDASGGPSLATGSSTTPSPPHAQRP